MLIEPNALHRSFNIQFITAISLYDASCQSLFISQVIHKGANKLLPAMSNFIKQLTLLALASTFFTSVLSVKYSRSESFVGQSWIDGFVFEAIDDPTHGRVAYVDKATANSANLTYVSSDTFIMRADHWSTLSPDGPGRQSVRIRSNKQYTTHVAVFDIRHMPQGCGTWPAVWETNGPTWPNGGEIDILEGVNDQGPNAAVIHSTAGCAMPPALSGQRTQTGTSTGDNCNNDETGFAGCGVQFTATPNSYGPAFNAAGGGWYALERTNHFLKVWFWSRSDPNVPADVLSGTTSVNTDNWGTPSAYFPDTNCDFTTHFDPHNIVINLTLCGDWAGNVYQFSGCPLNCIDYVNSNPDGFKDAYFEFASLNVYTLPLNPLNPPLPSHTA